MNRNIVALAITTLLFVSMCPAQQTTIPPSPNVVAGPVLGGDGTKNYVPIWATPSYLLSSVLYQDASKKIGIGTTTPAAALGDRNTTELENICRFLLH